MTAANSTISHISKLINRSTRRSIYYSLVHSQLYCSTVCEHGTDKTSYKSLLRQQNWCLSIIENRQNTQSVQNLNTNRNYFSFKVYFVGGTAKFIHIPIILNKFQYFGWHFAPRQKDTFGTQL